MQLDSKYARWYLRIVESARDRLLGGYGETHHILPRSLGGSDDPKNLVRLTAREHFICHWLLTKMVSGADRRKMCNALAMMMTDSGNRCLTNRQYERCKRARSEAMKGKLPKNLETINSAKIGRPRSEETKRRVSLGLTGKKQSPETIQKRATKNKGQKRTEEMKQRMREAQLLRWAKYRMSA